ncbi:MAG: hypothetical protein MUF68_03720 [Cyclobacteriaceae bacterium]|jgi:hypothetical protein|nr:hypothetical protein [Cyclobacteriaceae bacterium]
MKNHFFLTSLLSLTLTINVFSQVDTIQYKLNTIKSGDSIIYQFKGKPSMNFSIHKDEKWKGAKFRMWNSNNESFSIERVDKGEIYYINDAIGNRLATLTTKGNGMPDKIMMVEGFVFTYEKRRDGSWNATCDGRVYQVVRPEGLKKKPKNRSVILYNQISDDKVAKLFQHVSHLGLLHYTFIKEFEKNFNRSLGLFLLPL